MGQNDCPHGCSEEVYIPTGPYEHVKVVDSYFGVPPGIDANKEKCPNCNEEYYYWREEFAQ